MNSFKQFFLYFLLLVSVNAYAAGIPEIQKRWAVANYEKTGDAQTAAFEALVEDVNQEVAANRGNAELLIWKAIVESTYAGKASGFSALSLVKSARDALESAMEIDPQALNGSVYTSLGALYYQVPPWPIAFGSSKKARKLLRKALEVNPEGIDSNYFYGAFLVEEREYGEAKTALLKAMNAPKRPGREIADRGRRTEIRQLLDRIAEKGI
ncbi:MAG: hypothetical protein HOC70_09675 [Gammaproteobacteria bacterium]|jgi:tetratricopeptide (TPR) repeat protein|nr:hypothetical protein [Gammaproteobacteria bacterium]MBT4493504.1 hypothetical protein [Gammaproteobacteria bacterium]MBT7369728.1 hypothetical protein [Gammaproteobacteria bacterium]